MGSVSAGRIKGQASPPLQLSCLRIQLHRWRKRRKHGFQVDRLDLEACPAVRKARSGQCNVALGLDRVSPKNFARVKIHWGTGHMPAALATGPTPGTAGRVIGCDLAHAVT